MDIRIEGYRGISKAEINGLGVDYKIAFVCGNNAAGKTSVAQAIAAVMTGAPAPAYMGLKKSDLKNVVHKASGIAKVSATSEFGGRVIELPSGSVSEAGKLNASNIAVGSINLSAMDIKERSVALAKYLKTDPTKEDLAFALDGVGLSGTLETVWSMITEKGWDLALKELKERGAKAKGAWEAVTNASYGSKVAEAWVPEGFDKDTILGIPATGLVDLGQERAALVKELEAEIGRKAVSEDHIASLKERAKDLVELKKAVTTAEAAHKKAGDALSAIERKPELPSKTSTLGCPSCGALLVKIDGKLVESGGDIDTTAIEAKIADITRKETTAKEAISKAAQALTQARLDLSVAQAADEELKALEGAKNEATTRPRADIESDIAKIDALVSASDRYKKARDYAEKVKNNTAICKILSPDGLRQQKLASSIDKFNQELRYLCEFAGWRDVSIGLDLSIRYDNTTYHLLSESEKYRSDITIRSALATIEESPLVVMDGADILDLMGREGLALLAEQLDMPSIIMMTISDQSKAPRNEEGLCRVFWVERGTLSEMS